MPQSLLQRNLISITPTDLGDFQKSGFHQFCNNLLHHAFGDSHQNRNFSQGYLRVAIEAQQHVRVVRHKRPARSSCRSDVHCRRSAIPDFAFPAFFHRCDTCAELKHAINNTRTKVRVFCFAKHGAGVCMLDVLRINLCSPLTLSFALGVFARLVRSELSLPRDLYTALSIYLLFALGLKGGVELSHSSLASISGPAMVTILLGCLTPVSAYLVLRKMGRFTIADSAGIAAHYGSVSAVTFIAAQQFVASVGSPAEGFMPTLLTLLEIPGIQIALAIGAFQMSATARSNPIDSSQTARPFREIMHELLTSRSMMLLVGGLIIGTAVGETGWKPVQPVFEGLFKGLLTIFLLEMGLAAGSRLGDLKHAGIFLLGFGILMPIVHGSIGAYLGSLAGLSVGGCTVLAAMAASASYIAAPPAVRLTLPEANPTFYLTAALAITFPFNLLAGIPIYYEIAKRLLN